MAAFVGITGFPFGEIAEPFNRLRAMTPEQLFLGYFLKSLKRLLPFNLTSNDGIEL